MDVLPVGVTEFPGTARVLAAQGTTLPQPDQLCGPFAAYAALHAVLSPVVPMIELARAAGTVVWPEDDGESLPPGAAPDRVGWDRLARAETAELSGTTAAGLGRAIEAAGGAVTPVPAPIPPDALRDLLRAVSRADHPVAVVANLHSAEVLPPGCGPWSVGHFVVVWGVGEDDAGPVAALADSYPQLGEEGLPPGCRLVGLAALDRALAAPPGRGLLLLSRPEHRTAVHHLVAATGLAVGTWD